MSIMPQDPNGKTDSPGWIIEQGDDEDYIDFLKRQEQVYLTNPPPAPAGFQLVDCTAEPRHWPLYTIADGGYPPPCMYCAYDGLSEAHSGCEHAQHGRWRRWRPTHWLVRQLRDSGLMTGGYGKRLGGGCEWCLTSLPRWRGKRTHILWVKRETWRCLLRGRHLPGDQIAFGYCSKCLPCPSCGTTTAICSVSCGMSC